MEVVIQRDGEAVAILVADAI
ncbi:MAG: hypothetical protein QOJ08_1615, partial [Ilumatobacteraceae bacterium]